MVEDTLQQGVTQPNSSSFAFPSLLVKKKDLFWRFCIDYSKLIEMRVKNKFLVPIIKNLLFELHGAVVFSKIDLW